MVESMGLLDDTDRLRLEAALSSSPRPPQLILHGDPTRPAVAERLAKIAREVEEATSGTVAVLPGDGAGPPATPALTVSAAQSTVHYLAVPAGPETAPFVDLLCGLGESDADMELAGRLAPLSDPCSLVVLIAEGCPNCPHAVRAALRLAVASPWITTTIADLMDHPELAEPHTVESVPTTVVDGEQIMVGIVSPLDLAEAVVDRGTAGHERRVLGSLVESGAFGQARQRLASELGRQAFSSLWVESTLSSRIGLMLVAEQALDHDRGALDDIVGDVLPGLQSGDAALCGDTLDLLGRIGGAVAESAISEHLDDADEDVAEAAEEALSRIQGRS